MRRRKPEYGGIIRILEQFRLLPAIFFLKSRAECDAALKAKEFIAPLPYCEEFNDSLEELLTRFPALQNHRQLKALKSFGIAAHHGGQLPACYTPAGLPPHYTSAAPVPSPDNLPTNPCPYCAFWKVGRFFVVVLVVYYYKHGVGPVPSPHLGGPSCRRHAPFR